MCDRNIKREFLPLKAFKNENGSAILVALLVLVALTVIGIASINTSSIELKISQNEKVYKQNFNIAESAAMHAVKLIGNMDGQEDYNDLMPSTTSLVWLSDPGSSSFFENSGSWDYDDTGGDDNAEESADGTYMYAADFEGKQGGSSLKQGESSINLYSIYGMSQNKGGMALIDTGCKKLVTNP